MRQHVVPISFQNVRGGRKRPTSYRRTDSSEPIGHRLRWPQNLLKTEDSRNVISLRYSLLKPVGGNKALSSKGCESHGDKESYQRDCASTTAEIPLCRGWRRKTARARELFDNFDYNMLVALVVLLSEKCRVRRVRLAKSLSVLIFGAIFRFPSKDREDRHAIASSRVSLQLSSFQEQRIATEGWHPTLNIFD